MPNETAKCRDELYVVEVDGVKKSEHRIFVEALKCGMELKIRYPHSKVKLRDTDDKALINGSHMAKRTWNIGRSLDDEYSAATFAGRVGFAVDHAFIYLKGGGAWAHEKFAVSNNGANPLFITCGTDLTGTPIGCPLQGGTISASRWGWMIGTGIEYMFAPNWSAKIEYNFLDLGSKELRD